MTYRIQPINDALLRECLAERTHIYVDWLALLRGELSGEAQFDNRWFIQEKTSGQYIAVDSQPAPALRISLAEALSFALPLPGPVTEITGAHVNAFLRAMHAAKMEELLAPPKAEAGAETGAV